MIIYAEFQEVREYKYFNEGGGFMKATKVEPYLMPGCGSESVFVLDGRKSLGNQIIDCLDRIHRLRKVQNYRGFKIFRGQRFSDNNRCLYESRILPEEKK